MTDNDIPNDSQEMERREVLRDRIVRSRVMVAKMCSEGRPPKMSIPLRKEDEDQFICDTLRLCEDALFPDPMFDASAASHRAELEKVKGENERLREALEDARDKLCEYCRKKVPFNAAGSHGFDIHAKECKATIQREALKETPDQLGKRLIAEVVQEVAIEAHLKAKYAGVVEFVQGLADRGPSPACQEAARKILASLKEE